MLRKALALIVSILIAFIPSAIGNLVSPGTWFDDLDKPPLIPPGWVFGVVWTLLYLAMGVALYLIWRSHAKSKERAYGLFAIQGVLNASWSLVFFGIHQPWLGMIVIIALLIVIFASIREFRKISSWASYLFYPYAAWVAFATYLNMGVAVLN